MAQKANESVLDLIDDERESLGREILELPNEDRVNLAVVDDNLCMSRFCSKSFEGKAFSP